MDPSSLSSEQLSNYLTMSLLCQQFSGFEITYMALGEAIQSASASFVDDSMTSTLISCDLRLPETYECIFT